MGRQAAFFKVRELRFVFECVDFTTLSLAVLGCARYLIFMALTKPNAVVIPPTPGR